MLPMISGTEFIHKIAAAIGEDEQHIKRIIIDSGEPFEPLVIYVQKFGTSALLEVDFGTGELKVSIKEV